MRDHDENWWLDDSHPDGEAHREWLAKKDAEEVGRKAHLQLPPARRKLVGDDSIYEAIGQFVAKSVYQPLLKRIEDLEANQVTFGGTWKDGESYLEKCLVSFRGGLWLSKMPNNTVRPGEGPHWRLAVKAGTRRDVE